MKNIFLFPTDKPSRLHEFGDIWFSHKEPTECFRNYNIYITSDEKIKEEDFYLYCNQVTKRFRKNTRAEYPYPNYQKIILTTDQDLIADGVQAIDDEFLEWFVKNPSCKSVEIEESTLLNTSRTYLGVDRYKIIIPQEEPQRGITITHVGKQKTLEEASKNYTKDGTKHFMEKTNVELGFIAGAKWQAERMYSEEEVIKIAKQYARRCQAPIQDSKWFEQFKKK